MTSEGMINRHKFTCAACSMRREDDAKPDDVTSIAPESLRKYSDVLELELKSERASNRAMKDELEQLRRWVKRARNLLVGMAG
jgi:hypothetical protein